MTRNTRLWYFYAAAGSILAYGFHQMFRFYYWVDRSLMEVVTAKLRARNDEIGEFLRVHPMNLSGTKIKLIEKCQNASDYLKEYAAGSLKVAEVVLYYCHAAIKANDQTNCLTEVMFEEALKQAQDLDEHHASTGMLKGPLHGIPMSLKDTVNYRGKDSTIGVIKFAFKPKEEHAPIVQQLMDAGAVPFVKTNVPQTMMTFECRNPLWGQTENPYKKGYTPGGSSGGEAALIALKGSLLGIGSDVGGSLRIPAHFSGVVALKPSYNRISYAGSTGYYPATLTVKPVNGPMGRSVDDITLLSSVLMGPNPHDVRTIKTTFNKEVIDGPRKKLRFGIAYTDGFVIPIPAITRALDQAKEALLTAGHEVVEFVYPPNITHLVGLFYGLVSGDGGHHFLETLRGEPIDPTLRPFFLGMQVNPTIHRVFSQGLWRFLGDARFNTILSNTGVKFTNELITLEGQRVTAQQDFDQYWRQANIDCLLCPPNALPAVKYDTFTELNFAASYTFIWNLLDYSAGILPVTHVDKNVDGYPEDYKTPSHSLFKEDYLESMLHKHYDVNEMHGLPVSVQVVGLPYHEEEVLRAMKEVETALKAYSKPFQYLQ